MGSSPVALTIAGLVKEAIDRAGKAEALALRIKDELDRPYNHRTVSAWARGDAMPPADALLATVKVVGISVDNALGIGQGLTDAENRISSEGLVQQVNDLKDRLLATVEVISRLQDAVTTQGEAIAKLAQGLPTKKI